jgi:hypothetical protein
MAKAKQPVEIEEKDPTVKLENRILVLEDMVGKLMRQHYRGSPPQ